MCHVGHFDADIAACCESNFGLGTNKMVSHVLNLLAKRVAHKKVSSAMLSARGCFDLAHECYGKYGVYIVA